MAILFAAAAAAGTDQQLAQLRGDGISAVLYVASWRFVWTEPSYTELFGRRRPLAARSTPSNAL